MDHYDVMGDIHGQYGKLSGLLEALGYRARGETWRHPDGRRVLFLGDYIDRGPNAREVLSTVRAMVDSGDALALMGNHEYRAIVLTARESRRGRAVASSREQSADLLQTIAQFSGRPGDWEGWISWMRGLPLFVDLGRLRAVHACWDPAAVEKVIRHSLSDDAVLRACMDETGDEVAAIDRLLNGPEIAVPPGALIRNSRGVPMAQIRVRWWNLPSGEADLCSLALPDSMDGYGVVDPSQLRGVPNYPPAAPVVFFGHYWLSPESAPEPMALNVACLDFSAARNGPLVAYRWDGENALSPSKFLVYQPRA
jgi:hypothetical protein